MPLDAWLTLTIILGLFIVLVKTDLPPVVVIMGGLTLVMTFRLAPLEECLAGFSNKGVHTVGVLFIIAAGMYSTGAISIIADKLVGKPGRLISASLRILPAVSFSSAFLNNTPLVAMMIPVIKDITKTGAIRGRHLYIPLSYAAILGGSATLIGTSSNLVVAGMIGEVMKAKDAATPYMEKLSIFDPSVVAVPMVIVSLAFIMLAGARLLPATGQGEKREKPRRIYRAEFFAPRDSALIGRTVGEIGLNAMAGCNLEAVVRNGVVNHDVWSDLVIQARDVIVFHSSLDGLSDAWAINGLAPFNTVRMPETERFRHSLAQVAISRKSPVVGRKISELPLPGTPYRVTIAGVSRMGLPPDTALRDVRLEAGDVVVIEVDNSFYYQENNELFFSMIRKLKSARLQRVDRAVWALIITVLMISAAAFGWMPMLNAGLLAAGAMLVTGCIHFKGAARSVKFTTLVTIAGAIGIQSAITRSGLADGIASMLYSLGGGDPHMAILVIFIGCILMNLMLTSVATAVFMFPIALSLCGQLGASFMPFAITLMMGAACSFISPMGYQTNLMVMKPGGYAVKDYVRIGLPLTILCGAVTCFLAPLFFPFAP